ncbi:hypothetical protein I3842_01G152900 [Carya illinoinensis]|uniref:BRX domain-containing protein n=1 Tax=Carya illinoinensis TaxID=32201 RepID=A0A922G3Y6_CARIL|nr:hypothetical protein I3842_01G152900 [Carya illinoinensis]
MLSSTMRNEEKEVIEQVEPGVYVTVILLPDGTRVRFKYLSKYLTQLKISIIHFLYNVISHMPCSFSRISMHLYSQVLHYLHFNF